MMKGEITLGDPIPQFEGHPVDGAMMKMSGAMLAEGMEDVVVGIDDIVQVVAQFKCVSVVHDVERTTGKLVRVQVLRPVEANLQPFGEGDQGILRSPVTQIGGS